MKFIVEVSFPHEPFSTFVRDGTIGQRVGETLEAIKPEVVYFTDNGVGRGAIMIVDLESASQAPHVTEPLMLTFDASVHYRVAMAPDELAAAGLEKYATK
ncbi:MAG: panthothenate synthetase [Acidimicrobiia bacterium]